MRRTILAALPVVAVFVASSVDAAHLEHLQRLLKTNQRPNCDLSGADLKDTNLFGANLINANPKAAIWKGAKRAKTRSHSPPFSP